MDCRSSLGPPNFASSAWRKTAKTNEANGGLRQIFTDGRSLPDNDPQPWWFGYSAGKWDGDTLEIAVDDPKTFTKPWTVKLNQRLMPDTDLIEFICQENNRSLQHLVGK